MEGNYQRSQDNIGNLYKFMYMMSGSKGLSPTYEQAHVGLDLLTLVSCTLICLLFVEQLESSRL